MNGKFVEKYGTLWADMDSETRLATMMSEIFDTREDVTETKNDLRSYINQLQPICDMVKKHNHNLSIINWVGGVVGSGLLLGIIALLFKVIS